MYIHTYINIHIQTNLCSTHTLFLNMLVSNMTTFKSSANVCALHIYMHLTFLCTSHLHLHKVHFQPASQNLETHPFGCFTTTGRRATHPVTQLAFEVQVYRRVR